MSWADPTNSQTREVVQNEQTFNEQAVLGKRQRRGGMIDLDCVEMQPAPKRPNTIITISFTEMTPELKATWFGVLSDKVMHAVSQLTKDTFRLTALTVPEDISNEYPAVLEHWRLRYFVHDAVLFLKDVFANPADTKTLIGEALQVLVSTFVPG